MSHAQRAAELYEEFYPPGTERRRNIDEACALLVTGIRFDRWMVRCEKGLRHRNRALAKVRAFMQTGTFVGIERLRGRRIVLTPAQKARIEADMSEAAKNVALGLRRYWWVER